MYIKGASRRSVGFWARHLQDTKENLRADIVEKRGLAADDLRDMMLEMQQDASLTRCKNFMYIASFNPCPHEHPTERQWEQMYEIFEKHRGIPAGQQRIVIEHEKEGRTHRHVVWNRIDLENMRAFPDGKDAKICDAAKKEIELELGLERTPGMLDREPGTPPPQRGPKSYEMYRGMKSGLDPRDITAEVTAIFRESEHAADFVEGLRQHGYELVQGRRAFCILDSAGQEHSLARRLDGINTKELRTFMQGLDLTGIPTVEQGKAQFQERMQAERQADLATVQREIAWEEALAKAAIEKEKIERRFVEPTLDKIRSSDGREKAAVQQERPQPPAPELGRTAGEIRLAYSLTQTGQEFANALEDRGFILARMTDADAERLNRWERQRLKEEWQAPAPEKTGDAQTNERDKAVKRDGPWMAQRGGVGQLTPELRESAERSYQKWTGNKNRYDFANYVDYTQKRDEENKRNGQGREEPQEYQKYRAGELVAVSQYGHVFQLTYRNTGDGLKARTEHLKDIDRAPLLSVTAAEGVMKKFQQHRREERQKEREQKREEALWPAKEKHWPVNPPQPERQSPGLFGKAATEATRDSRLENLHGAAAHVWTAWRESDSAKAFAAALEDKGIAFAVVTKDEAERSHKLAQFARAAGNYSPRFKEGEIVIVTEARPEHLRNGELTESRSRVHKLDQSLAEKCVKGLDNRSTLQGIDATKQVSDQRAQQRAADWQAIRLERATNIWRGGRKRAGHTKDNLLKSPAAILKPVAMGLNVIGKPLELLGNVFEGLFAPKLTPGQIREGEIAARERQADAREEIDFSNTTAQRAQERQRLDNEREAERQQHRQRDVERER